MSMLKIRARSAGIAAILLTGIMLTCSLSNAAESTVITKCGCNNYPHMPGAPAGEQTVVTCWSPGSSDFVLGLIDVSVNAPAYGNMNGTITNWFASMYHGPTTDQWTRATLGCIFGLALDKNGDIYTTASSCYSDPLIGGTYVGDLYPPCAPGACPSSFPCTAPCPSGTVWKIDDSGVAYSLIVLPNLPDASLLGTPDVLINNRLYPQSETYPGLGNIAYDCDHDQLLVTNLEDGKIYRISPSGTILGAAYDHGGPDNGIAGFAPLGERLWGVAYYGGRVYYSVWWENGQDYAISGAWNGGWPGTPSLTEENEIWSKGLLAGGGFDSNPAVLEISMPPVGNWAGAGAFNGWPFSNPVADIEFSPSGRMLLGERTMADATSTAAHRSRVLEYVYDGVNGVWVPSTSQFHIDYDGVFNPYYPSAVGGVDYANCLDVWAMADALHNSSYPHIYGLVNMRGSGGGTRPNDESYFIDVDADLYTTQKRYLGDVDAPCMAAVCGVKWNDQDLDAFKDPTEPLIPNWQMTINPGGQATTNLWGRYSFMPLTPGSYALSEVLQPNWAQTFPIGGGAYAFQVAPGTVRTDIDFGNGVQSGGYISGIKYSDLDCDCIRDPTEPGIQGWTITLSGPINATTTTVAGGYYSFTNLPNGTYTVSEITQPGWVLKCPATGEYTVVSDGGEALGIDFGNCPCVATSDSCITPPECTAGWWPFDEGSGSVAADVAGGNNGSVVGATWVPGIVDNCLLFNSSTNRVDVGAVNNLLDVGLGDLSLDAWILSDNSDPSQRMTMDRRDVNGVGFAFYIQNNRLNFAAWDGIGGVPPPVSGGPILTNGNWQFVAATACRCDNGLCVTLYVNGVAVATGSISVFGSITPPMGAPLVFGQPTAGTGPNFSGLIDEPEVFNCCISAEDIASLYAVGSTGKCRDACYVPPIVTSCGLAASTELTVCNYAPWPQTYTWAIAGLPAAGPCTIAGPSVFSPVTGSITVPGAALGGPSCATVTIDMVLPSTITMNDLACYEISLLNDTTHNCMSCTGHVRVSPEDWIGPPDDDDPLGPGPMIVGNPSIERFRITNVGPEPRTYAYTLIGQSADGDTDNQSISLNSLPPGTPVTGSLSIAAGDSADVSVQVTLTQVQLFNFHEVELLVDLNGDSVEDPAAVLTFVSVPPNRLVAAPEAPTGGGNGHYQVAVAPNPFSASVSVSYVLPEAREVEIRVHDVSGRLVKQLESDTRRAGKHSIVWDGRNGSGIRVGSGVYFVRIRIAKELVSTRVLLIP